VRNRSALGHPRVVRLAGVPVILGGALAVVAPMSPADATGAITPFVDCVSVNAATGVDTAHFGYSSTMGSVTTISPGDLNFMQPNPIERGQPSAFTEGVYHPVSSVQFFPPCSPKKRPA